MTDRVAIVHDYLTQRGGAERVVVSLLDAFPEAPLYTSLFEPAGTYPAFASRRVETLPLNRFGLLRRNHRAALPFLAPAFSRLRVDAQVCVCSSSGWAHGVRTPGRKVVYCHSPARWLYQTKRYLGGSGWTARLPTILLGPPLRRWDERAAKSADRYLVNSTVIREMVWRIYGRDAEVLSPPPGLETKGPVEEVPGVEPGFLLCVSRLLAYKNVEQVVLAGDLLPSERLVVAGGGPLEAHLKELAPLNVTILGEVGDSQLRWLYRESRALVAASYEDFGLTPVEAAGFAKPSVVLREGGFLDTTLEGRTGLFFDQPTPALIARAVKDLLASAWDPVVLREHHERFSAARFVSRFREIVEEELAGGEG